MATRNERREQARETARMQREAEQRRRRRIRWAVNGGIGAGLVAVVAVVALIVTTGGGGAVRPANTAHDAVTITASGAETAPPDASSAASEDDPDRVDIVVYADYLCPFCGQFETANSAQIQQWVANGSAALEFHPIAILDRLSMGSAYSTRAANALACVADASPDAVPAFNDLLFQRQPAEGTEGLTDAQLAEHAATAGAGDVSACIDGRDFEDWVGEATERAADGESSPIGEPVQSTPTVLVDGHPYAEWLSANRRSLADPAAFAEFVAEVGDVPVS